MIVKVISGGQVGADIAALRTAHRLHIPTGGWMPYGGRTLDGDHPEYVELYGMQWTKSCEYPVRTRRNVRDSDATLALASSFTTAGEQLTQQACWEIGRRYHAVPIRIQALGPPLIELDQIAPAREFLMGVHVLNVAGNANTCIEEVVEGFLEKVLRP